MMIKTAVIYSIILTIWIAAYIHPLWAAKNPEPVEGWKALKEKRYDDALKSALNVLNKYPYNEDAQWLAAEVTLAQKDTASSLKYWYAVLEADPVHPKAVMNLVEILLARSDTTGAQQVLDYAAQKKPDMAEIVYSQGILMQARGQHAEAMVKLSQAIDRNPQEPRFYIALARVYKDKNILPLTKQYYLSALELDSSSAEVHYELAMVLMELKEYSDALAQFKSAREINPDFPNVNYQIGKLYFYAEKYEQATQELQIALQKAKEDNFFLSSFYGQSLRSLRRLEEAQEHLEKAYSLNPNEPSTARALATNSFELKKFDRAIEILKGLVILPEVDPADYARLGEAYYNIAGKDSSSKIFYDSSAVYLKKGYELNPENSRLAYLLGMTYFNSDQYDSALVYFTKKIQADTTSFPAYFYLGYCCLKKENYQDAIINLRHANQLDSTKVSVHMMLAQTLTFVDSTKAAKQEFSIAIELDSTLVDAYGGLGFIYLTEENWSNAASNLKRATELQPTNANYWLAYGQALYYLQDYDTAERAFRRVLQYEPKNKDAINGLNAIRQAKAIKRL